MIHHYLKKGISPEQILNLNPSESLFYFSSMELELEELKNQYQCEGGGVNV